MKRRELVRVVGATLVLASAAGIVGAAVQIAQNHYLQAGMVRLAVLTLEERVYACLLIGGLFVVAVALFGFLLRIAVKLLVTRVVAVRLRNPDAAYAVAAGALFFLLGRWGAARVTDLSAGTPALLSTACLLLIACLVGMRVARMGRSRLSSLLDYKRLLPLSAGWPVALLFLLLLRSGIVVDGIPHSPKHPNVIFIVIDALRPDHLGCWGYAFNTSPNIDRLAAEGTRFKTAVTVYPRTTPSAVSLLTGLYPHTHGTRVLYSPRGGCVALRLHTLPELLKNEHYLTAAFLDQPLLARGTGIEQGFSSFSCLNSGKVTYRAIREQLDKQGDTEVTQRALAWLRRNRMKRQPLFLFLWYLAPHWQYAPPVDDLRALGGTGIGEIQDLLIRDRDPNITSFTNNYTDEELTSLIGAYDAEVHFVDRQIGWLIAYLKVQGLYDNTLIVVTSDHGESLGEHGVYFEHGEYYYDTDALVPLIIKRPGQRKGEVIQHQVRTIDIAPTILHSAGIPDASEGMDLFPAGAGAQAALRSLVAFGESDHSMYSANRRRYLPGDAGKWRIARTNRTKLIYIPRPTGDLFELYDLTRDPGEMQNLIDDPAYKDEGARLRDELFGWMKVEDRERIEEAYRDEQDRALTERLKSLGYL